MPDVIIGDEEGISSQDNNYFVFTDRFEFDNYASSSSRTEMTRHAGLLSLVVELPEGGVQRKFEALTGKARVEIGLMDSDSFKRAMFIVWIAVVLVLGVTYLVSRRTYRVLFILTLIVTLLFPVLSRGPWIAFFNSAFQGAMFSLVVPLVMWLVQRTHRQLSGPAATALLAVVLCLPGRSARAESAPDVPVRIAVPYDPSRPPMTSADPLSFMSREDFTRLWNAGQPANAQKSLPDATLLGVDLDGLLEPEFSRIRGELRIQAVNPSDSPASMSLGLGELAIDSIMTSSAGANLACYGPDAQPVSNRKGRPAGQSLYLVIDAHWSGSITAAFDLPCQVRGSTGRLHLTLPDPATGTWRVRLPYASTSAQSGTKSQYVVETSGNESILFGPVRPGALDVAWTGSGTRRSGESAANDWRSEISTTVVWDTPMSARWSSTVDVEAAGQGALLARELQFDIDPSLRVFAANGEKLLGAAVTDNSITVRLAETPVAQFVLEGVLVRSAPDTSGTLSSAQPWAVRGLKPASSGDVHSSMSLQVAEAIEVLSVKSEGLERRTPKAPVPAFSTYLYETSRADWTAQIELRRPATVFEAGVSELFAPGDGLVRQAACITLTPRNSRLYECAILLGGANSATTTPTPSQSIHVLSLSGDNVSGWVQAAAAAQGTRVTVRFDPPVEKTAVINLTAVTDLPQAQPPNSGSGAGTMQRFSLAPTEIEGVSDTQRTVAVFVPADQDLSEQNLAGATVRVPGADDQRLLGLLYSDPDRHAGTMRGYKLASARKMTFSLAAADTKSLVTVYNQATISDGLQSLDATITADPRRGRVREIEAYLVLPESDPTAAARISMSGPVRNTLTDQLTSTVIRLRAELAAPQASRVTVRVQLDMPAATDGTKPVHVAYIAPSGTVAGERAFLLVRRSFEGEMTLADVAGGKRVDPVEVKWSEASSQSPGPGMVIRPLPSDLAIELVPSGRATPSVNIVRHERQEALRAVVKTLRQRSILTADGFERHEIEIALQNESEQFLKVALPYPKSEITVYEVQVASRPVETTFGTEAEREVLLVPLIRTGLLEPVLSVRVAYVVGGRPGWGTRGEREQRLPDILGGVPVSAATMVLVLPTNYKYSDFQGTMNPWSQLNEEAEEIKFQAETVKDLSEVALQATGGKQRQALSTIERMQGKISGGLESARLKEAANRRIAAQRKDVSKAEDALERQLEATRELGLKEAGEAQKLAYSNVARIQQAQSAAQPAREQELIPSETGGFYGGEKTGPAVRGGNVATIEFPRVGEVHMFKQWQGTGKMRFSYVLREFSASMFDILFAIAVTIVSLLAVRGRRVLFGSWRRFTAAVLAICVIAACFKVALDVTIPLAGLCAALLIRSWKRKTPESPPAEA